MEHHLTLVVLTFCSKWIDKKVQRFFVDIGRRDRSHDGEHRWENRSAVIE
jgi:hypothetical protein